MGRTETGYKNPVSVEMLQSLALEEIQQWIRQLQIDQVELERENSRLREQKEQLQKMIRQNTPELLLGQVAITATHEMRNPLMAARMGVEYLLRSTRLAESNQRGVSLLQTNMERLERIIEDILFLAHLAPLTLHPVYLRTVVEQQAGHVLSILHHKQANLRLELAHNLPALLLDAERINQALAILLYQRAAAIQPGEQLRLVLRGDQTAQTITLIDGGYGIPAEQPGRVFEPFYKYRTTDSGLELFVVQQVIQCHQGEITVQQRRRGGVQWVITLPA